MNENELIRKYRTLPKSEQDKITRIIQQDEKSQRITEMKHDAIQCLQNNKLDDAIAIIQTIKQIQ
jgi:ethanolamine ammonia-lyase large subunit